MEEGRMLALRGHTSPETAKIVENYPYGYKRCRIRYWIETRKGMGQRFVSQTEHPTRKIWNAPKKSNYNAIAIIVQEQEGEENPGFIHHHALSVHSSLETINKFGESYYNNLDDDTKIIYDDLKRAVEVYEERRKQRENQGQPEDKLISITEHTDHEEKMEAARNIGYQEHHEIMSELGHPSPEHGDEEHHEIMDEVSKY